MGRYVLTGSQNFLLLEKITQSLAGRAAILHLMPFSASEVESAGLFAPSLDEVLFKGMYPPLFDRPVAPADFYPSYIETYLERDVRSMRNIGDLALFRKFILLCAGRTGQLLNMTALGNEAGVDHKTIRAWLSVLEASFIIFLLRPYHRSWNKRVVKQPKLYFYDTGLLCSLLGLRKPADLASHHLRGSIYENYVIAEHIKQQYHSGIRPAVFFWRDQSGHEVDLIIEDGPAIKAVEIKSSETINPELFAGLRWFCGQAGLSPADCTLVYGGTEEQSRSDGRVLSWKRAHLL
jgi:predicted AAA+ superfamily ATPase